MSWELVAPKLGRQKSTDTTVRFGLTPRGQYTEYLSDALVRAAWDAVQAPTVYVRHLIDRERTRVRLEFSATRGEGALKVPRAGSTINRYMAVDVLGITKPESCVVRLSPANNDRTAWEGDIPEPFASRVRPTPIRKERSA